ncbi:MAG: tetratricopeptide repeat protein [Desulfovibrio sp.]|jgi:tetratricopeptide (TPR) repeat protein|nr:tetratricopeptide repeat protein [Desulfovibrio sp.]
MSQIDYEINKELGECYLFMGELDKARSYYQKAAADSSACADPYLGLAAIAVSEGSLPEALDLYRKAHDVAPGVKSLTGMAMVEAELGSREEAFAHYRAVLELDPGNMLAINNYLQLGHALNRLEEVIPFLEAALAEAEDAEVIRYALAGCLTVLGREEEAKSHLEILLRENPSHDVAQQLYAQFAA